jgi:hypothetical protein
MKVKGNMITEKVCRLFFQGTQENTWTYRGENTTRLEKAA